MALLRALPARGRPRSGVVHGDFRAWAKLRAGVRRFGLWSTAMGLARLAWVRCQGRGWRSVRERDDGLLVGFATPEQQPEALLLYGRLMEPEYELVRQVVGEGSVVLDVGGGIGTYALVAARHGARVHVFEPWKDNVAAIRRNAVANHLDAEIVVQPVAVSESEGSADLAQGGNAFETRVDSLFDDPERGGVRTVTLDAYCAAAGIETVDVLKIDVEGHEDRVLAGARDLLARGAVRLVIVELGRSYATCRQVLERHGLEVMYYLDQTNELVPMAESDHADAARCRPTGFHCNVVAVAPERVPASVASSVVAIES